jgi:anti-sigma B factor antagonist
MEIKENIEQGILFLSLEGDLIGESNGAQIVERVTDFISEGGAKCAIDLAGVRYMNSSGIGVLITLLTKMKNVKGEMVLVNPSDQIKKLLTITKLDAVFTAVESQKEALIKLS